MKGGFALLLISVLALACTPESGIQDRPVATIAGTPLTRGSLDAYLEKNLAQAEPVEGETEDEDSRGDLVRSLLFDTWIDERLVLAEAQVRGLSIDTERLDEMLDDPDFESGDGDRRSQRMDLRDRLLIELVQSQVLHGVRSPTADEATAWLAEKEGASEVGKKVRLRSLRFDDETRALEVHRGLRRNRLTFNEAIVQNTDDESQGAPTIVSWETLPPEVREALEDLKPAWSSTPVDVAGGTFLFQVLAWIEPDPESQIEAARAAMFSDARRVAWMDFVADLRETEKVRIVTKNLPFRYVSEDSD